MYTISPLAIKTFIEPGYVTLPRFQRKQTWDDKSNFELCISVFKNYPIGVCVISQELKNRRTVKILLDGRQRRNALQLMYQDPENIYNWARKFIGFKNNMQPYELEFLFKSKISEYLEDDSEEEEYALEHSNDNIPEQNIESSEMNIIEHEDTPTELDLLLKIIMMVHNRKGGVTGYTMPFDFRKEIISLPYVVEGGQRLDAKLLTTFIRQYETNVEDSNEEYLSKETFKNYMLRYYKNDISNQNKLISTINENWDKILDRIKVIDDIDDLYTNCTIGIIEVSNLSPADSQKIFNIINSKGSKLTAVEILSAKPSWNIKINNPSGRTIDAVNELYKRLAVPQDGVVKWDVPATLVKRISPNIVISQDPNMSTELTTGFKIFSGIFENGIKKGDIDKLANDAKINWNSESFVSDIKDMLMIIEDFEYFKYLKSWHKSIMELTSDGCSLDFIIVSYLRWDKSGKPRRNGRDTRAFQKECFILWDKLIYEYVNRQWRGSSDTRVAANIKEVLSNDQLFSPVSKEQWNAVLDELFSKNTINGAPVKINEAALPILYHSYCMSSIGPDLDLSVSSNNIDVDHILPQSLFDSSVIDNSIKDNILNLGLLPKKDNISKGNKTLRMIESNWLQDQIVRYEFIDKDKFDDYSNLSNYQKMFNNRENWFRSAFNIRREDILNK